LASWDNAVTETLFGLLKVERLRGMHLATRRQAKDDVIDWLQFYNHGRLHSTLGYLSPMAFKKNGLPIKKGSPHDRSAKGDAKRGQVQPILPENLIRRKPLRDSRNTSQSASPRRRITIGLLFNRRLKMGRQGWNVPIDREGFSRRNYLENFQAQLWKAKS
jgi:hypothetical protein